MDWNAEILGPVIKDLTKAWQLFDDGVATAKENCFTALVGLVDGIGEDLACKRFHRRDESLTESNLTLGTAEEGISMEPMAPFLSSLASKKTLLRKCLDDFSANVNTISRFIVSIMSFCDILMVTGILN